MAVTGHDAATQGTHIPRIVASWALVGIPLAYGIWQAILNSLKLLSG